MDHAADATIHEPEFHSNRSSHTRFKFSIFSKPMEGRNQTISQCSEPNSRTTLEGEQPYPFQLLHRKDVMSRHRGRKPWLQYELSIRITLLSLEYLLSYKRRSFHKDTPDHYKLRLVFPQFPSKTKSEGKILFLPVRPISLTVQPALLLLHSKLQ